MPPLRAPRLRVALVTAALVLACALGAYPAAMGGELMPVTTALALLGVAFTAVAVVRWIRVVGAALACLAGEFLLTEGSGAVATLSIVFYAAGLPILCELIFEADRLRGLARVDRSVVVAGARRLGLIAAGSAVLAIVVLAATGLHIGGSLALTFAGAVAGFLLLALPLLMRHGDRQG